MQCKVVPPNEGEALTVVGDVLVLKLTEADTGGRFVLGEGIVRPGGGPPPHLHAADDELFYVLEGEVDFFRADTKYPARTGSTTWAPRNVVHTFSNVGSVPLRSLVFALPCNFEHFYRECGEPFTIGSELPAPTAESIQRLLDVAPKFGIQIHPTHKFPKTAAVKESQQAYWVLGERVVCNLASSDSGGNFTVCTIHSPPGGGPPKHLHRDCDEIFYVVSGNYEFELGDRKHPAAPGTTVYVPRGQFHGYKNAGPSEASLVDFHTPGGFERFFEEVGTPCKGNQMPPVGKPDRDTLMALIAKHGMELPPS